MQFSFWLKTKRRTPSLELASSFKFWDSNKTQTLLLYLKKKSPYKQTNQIKIDIYFEVKGLWFEIGWIGVEKNPIG